MNVTLIGYRGTGKSTVARLLAERLGWKWVDADAYLEQKARQTISQIFDTEGEQGFRRRETEVITDLTGRDRTVLAAGGGAVLREENRQAICRSGLTVWLVASPEAICQRMETDTTTASRRPRLTACGGIEEIRKLLSQREPLYRACADLVVSSEDRSAHEIADELAAWVHNKGVA